MLQSSFRKVLWNDSSEDSFGSKLEGPYATGYAVALIAYHETPSEESFRRIASEEIFKTDNLSSQNSDTYTAILKTLVVATRPRIAIFISVIN